MSEVEQQDDMTDETPTSHDERRDAVSELIRGQDSELSGNTASGGGEGTQREEEETGGSDSGGSELDIPQPDTVPGVDADTEGSEEGSDTITVKGLAEHLEIEPGELYELEIPIGEGETISLGDMKDQYKKYGSAKEYEERVQKADDKYHKQVLATRAELNAILGAIPEEIRANVMSVGRERSQQYTIDQGKQVLEAIPEWADVDSRAKDRDSIIAMGSEYGFSEPEMTFTQDHRALRMLRDFAKMRNKVSEMDTAAKRKPGKIGAPGKTKGKAVNQRKLKASLARAKGSKVMSDKVSVVSQLIQSGRK
jgi:hypothetical protein